MSTLAGRVAAVTGAASGIGAACARALHRAGAEVVAIDRDHDGVHALAHELDGTALTLDLSDTHALPDALQAADLQADVLVNCAGVQHVAPVHEFPPAQLSLMLRLMLEAPFLLTRQVLPRMYERGWGRVVNISSIHGQRASAYKAAYVAAKHGLEGLSKTIALEGAPHGVGSFTVCPGYVRTPLVAQQITDQARAHGIAEDAVVADVLLERSAVKQLLEPEDVAEAVLWLCRPAAMAMTGTSLVLDGGWSAS